MAKFNTTATRPATFSPVVTEAVASGRTYEGGAGHARDIRSELFLLAVANMVGESTFYEAAGARDARYLQLVRAATAADPEWTAGFLRWLRGEGNMRSAALVGAAEFVKARIDAGEHGMGRQVVDSVCQRADEPGEMLGYWTATYGRAVPKPVKRGVADAAARLYNERSLVKWDSEARGFRFADVLDLTHPTPSAPWQGDLFTYALDLRHGHAETIPESLSTLRARAELMARPVESRRDVLAWPNAAEVLREAGMTWEALAGWLQGPMDAAAWEAVIPSMGYMALLRNLRNFDQAGVSDEVAATVAAKLADPEQVAGSRQLPMRFLSAYRAAPSLRWSWPLERALDASLANIPHLRGRTLILVDTSDSMNAPFSKDGTLMRWDAAVVFGLALGARCASADVVSFSAPHTGGWGRAATSGTRLFKAKRGESVLSAIGRWKDEGYFLAVGTDTPHALRTHFDRHDRVVILTDEQSRGGPVGEHLPATPIYSWNLAGYRLGHGPSGSGNRHTFGGLSDAAFKMVPLLEAGANATWPWLATAA